MSAVRYTEARKRKIVEMYEKDKLSAAAISRHRATPTEKTILRILRNADVKIRGNPRKYDRAKIRKDLAKDLPVKEIAARHGCSERFVYNCRKENS